MKLPDFLEKEGRCRHWLLHGQCALCLEHPDSEFDLDDDEL